MVKRFQDSRRSGIYFSVVQEGEVGMGDTIELIHHDENHVTVADINQLNLREKLDLELLHRAVQVKALPEKLRHHFQEEIARNSV